MHRPHFTQHGRMRGPLYEAGYHGQRSVAMSWKSTAFKEQVRNQMQGYMDRFEDGDLLLTMASLVFRLQLAPTHLLTSLLLFCRYGEGYMLTVKVGGMNPDLSKVETFVKSISNAVLKESHCNTIMVSCTSFAHRLISCWIKLSSFWYHPFVELP